MGNRKQELGRLLDHPGLRNVGLAWAVAEDYALLNNVQPGRPVEQVIEVEKVGKCRFYNPLQEFDLFLSFARLAAHRTPSTANLLRWVEKYGLLRRKIYDDPYQEIRLKSGELNQLAQPIQELVAETREAYSALRLYDALNRGGIDALKKRIRDLCHRDQRREVLSRLDSYFVEEWGDAVRRDSNRHSYDGNLRVMACVQLDSFVEERVRDVRLSLHSFDYAFGQARDMYNPLPTWECTDLFSAIYLQFYLWVSTSLPMRLCESPSCRMPFPVTRSNKRHCNPTCRSNARHHRDTNADTNLGGTPRY